MYLALSISSSSLVSLYLLSPFFILPIIFIPISSFLPLYSFSISFSLPSFLFFSIFPPSFPLPSFLSFSLPFYLHISIPYPQCLNLSIIQPHHSGSSSTFKHPQCHQIVLTIFPSCLQNTNLHFQRISINL